MFKKYYNPLVLQTPKLRLRDVMESVGARDRLRLVFLYFPPNSEIQPQAPSLCPAIRWPGRDSAPGGNLNERRRKFSPPSMESRLILSITTRMRRAKALSPTLLPVMGWRKTQDNCPTHSEACEPLVYSVPRTQFRKASIGPEAHDTVNSRGPSPPLGGRFSHFSAPSPKEACFHAKEMPQKSSEKYDFAYRDDETDHIKYLNPASYVEPKQSFSFLTPDQNLNGGLLFGTLQTLVLSCF